MQNPRVISVRFSCKATYQNVMSAKIRNGLSGNCQWLVWGDQKRMERIRVDGAVSVETAIREAVRSCGRQIA